jgi:hypothetical protein
MCSGETGRYLKPSPLYEVVVIQKKAKNKRQSFPAPLSRVVLRLPLQPARPLKFLQQTQLNNMEADLTLSNTASGNAAESSKKQRKKRKSETTTIMIEVQAKKRAKGKGKAGKLEGLMLLPMDVLFEVRLQLLSCPRQQLLRKTVRYSDICDLLTYCILHVLRSSSEVS